MTNKKPQKNERHGGVSGGNQDKDWVMVEEDVPLAKQEFELIDAAEAKCWCGGPDADRCRRYGHTWPLQNPDQGDVKPKQPDEASQPQDDDKEEEKEEDSAGDKSSGDQTAGEQRPVRQAKETEKPAETKPAKGRVPVPPPTSHSSGPFTKLAILTDLLDPTRNNDNNGTN